MLKRCGLFFIIVVFLSYFNFAFCSVDLEPIVITKNKVHLLNPYSLESDNLKNLPSDSFIESLNILPIDLQSRSPKSSIQTDFSLRGSTFQGVLMLIDGQRINDPQTAHHNSDIPLTEEDIKRIEVIPGVSSSVFGPDAIGGAINIILKKPQSRKIILKLKGGQYQTGSGLFSISDKIDNLGIRLSLENQESKGFHYDTDFKKFTTTLNSSLDLPDGEFDINWGYQEKEFGAYDFYTPGKGNPSKEWTKTYLLNTGLNLDKAGLIIKPNFLWRRHYDKFMLDKTKPQRGLNHHRTDMYTPNIYFQNQIKFLGMVGFGFEYGEERINSTNLGKYNRNHWSVFMDDSKDLTPRVSLGSSFRSDDYDDFGQNYTGSLNFRYKLSKINELRFGISRSIRIPSFTELYYNDAYTLGNADLSSEKSLNYELGYACAKESLSFGLTFFFRQEEDFIDWVSRNPVLPDKWKAENITEAEVFGIENYLKWKINDYITLNSNYSYINKRINDRGFKYKYGPNYIKHLINNIFSLKLPFGMQTIGLTYKKKPVRRGWFLLNTRLSYNLNKTSQFFVEVSNLLNVEYQEIEGIPQPGRWVEAGFRLEW
jgi:iron complex outermembrane receptor protein